MTQLTWHDKKKHIQEITQWKWIYITIPEITQSFESAIIFTMRREARGVLTYMGYIGMCRCEGYGFQAVYSRIGYINQSV